MQQNRNNRDALLDAEVAEEARVEPNVKILIISLPPPKAARTILSGKNTSRALVERRQ